MKFPWSARPVRVIPPYNENAVPPMGSLGDAWDEHIEAPIQAGAIIPTAATVAAAQPIERLRSEDLKSLRWIPPVHFLAVLSGIALGLALASTGPLYPFMKYFAAAGVLLGLAAAYVIHERKEFFTGYRWGIAVAVVSAALLMVDVLPGMSGPRALLETAEARKARPGTNELISRVRGDMAFVARVVRAAKATWGTSPLTASGPDGMNSGVLTASRAYRVPTLAVFPERFAPSPGLKAVERRDLPSDPFADSPRAMYEVQVFGSVGLVLSPGPDARPDIDLLKDFNPLLADPASSLSAKTYDPTNGALSSGDLFEVFRVDGATEEECSGVARELENFRWRR